MLLFKWFIAFISLHWEAETSPTWWSRYGDASWSGAAGAEGGVAGVHAGVTSSDAGGVHHTEPAEPAWCADGARAAVPERVVAGVKTSIPSSHAGLSLRTTEGGDSDDKEEEELGNHGLTVEHNTIVEAQSWLWEFYIRKYGTKYVILKESIFIRSKMFTSLSNSANIKYIGTCTVLQKLWHI